MKNEFLLDSLQAVDDTLVQEAGENTPKKRRYWFIPAAAALAASICAVAVLAHLALKRPSPEQNAHTSRVPAAVNLINATGGFDKNVVLSYKNDVANAEDDAVDLVYDYVPEDDMAKIDWVPYFRYNGRLYWHAFGGLSKEEYRGAFVLKVKQNPAKLPIDCVEGQGYIGGEFYEVKGYDPDFMLCMADWQYPDELEVFICDNGYSVTYGRDVFEERFSVSSRLKSVIYEDADSIFHAYGKRFSAPAGDPAVRSFIEALDSGVWCVPYETEEEYSALCETDPYTFWLDLGDFTVRVQICGGRYARIVPMFGAYFIEVDEEKIAPIIEYLESSHGESVENTATYRGMTLEDATAEPTFGRFVPKYVAPGQTLDYCMGKYEVEHGTLKTVGIERLHVDYESDSGKNEYVWFDITGEDAMLPEEGEDPKIWIEITDLTEQSLVPIDIGRPDEYYVTRVHGEGACIEVTSLNIPREELVKMIRSSFGLEP